MLSNTSNRTPQDIATVLVTGGCGFIGANLVRNLCQSNIKVTILDKFVHGPLGYLDGLGDCIEVVEGDILDFPLIKELVSENDAIVHLAAQSGVTTSIDDPLYDMEINVQGTLNLLEACRLGLRNHKFVMASSNAVLGRQDPPAREDKAPLPVSPYGASKLAAESYCMAYFGTWSIPTIVLRFGNVYGPYSSHKSTVVSKFLQSAFRNESVTIDGDGMQTRDYIYVGDLCDAIYKSLTTEVSGEVFQIATGIETSVASLATKIETLFDGNFSFQKGPARLGDVRKNFSSVEKAKNLLLWEPKTDLDIGLHLTWEWFKGNLAVDKN